MAVSKAKRVAILGRKVGMTRFFLEDGKNVPVTVLQVGPCPVTQIKTTESDSYSAIQLSFDEIDPKNSTFPLIGHDGKAGVSPQRFHQEYRFEDDKEVEEYELGQVVTLADFEGVHFVDVSGTTKGKGFQGGVKRHGFKGQLASHGVKRRHRSPGSIGGHATNLGTGPKIKKGKRMAGHMGDVHATTRNHEVVKVIAEKNLLLIKGTVPGANSGLVFVRSAVRLGRSKQLKAAEKMKG